MAFSSTMLNVQYPGAGKVILSGSWSGAAGDTAGSIAVYGTVLSARFEKFDSDNTYQGLARVSSSVSSGITTLTVNNQDNVTTGYFTIEKLGN